MTFEEAKKALNSFKEKGRSEEDIAKTLYLMFVNDDIDVQDLGTLLGIVGYELTDEFLNMSPEDQKTKVLEDDNEESSSNEEPSLNKESTEKTVEDEKPETDNKESVDETKEPVESDDTQEEKALKLFGLK